MLWEQFVRFIDSIKEDVLLRLHEVSDCVIGRTFYKMWPVFELQVWKKEDEWKNSLPGFKDLVTREMK